MARTKYKIAPGHTIRSHRIALDPTDKQITYFKKACGVARLAYNWALAEWQEQYAMGGKPNERELRRLFNSIKDQRYPFCREVTKCAPQLAIMNLGHAFDMFFRRVKEGDCDPGYPVFKRKGKSRDAFEVDNISFVVSGFRINIAKIGWVRMREASRFDGKVISATISQTAGRWFVSIAVNVAHSIPSHDGPTVGIDWGCADFATLSTNEIIEGPKPHKALFVRFRRLDRSLHRKLEGSRNRAKAKATLARLHARTANIRRDFLHKFTTSVVKRFSVVGIEDLNVSGMSKNHALARSVLDQSPGEMRRQLEYKAPLYGSRIVVVDRFEPTSKRCNECGHRLAELKLDVREWVCPSCGTLHDRDLNAAKNLEKLAARPAVIACGEESSGRRAVSAPAKLASVKQEPDSFPTLLFGIGA